MALAALSNRGHPLDVSSSSAATGRMRSSMNSATSAQRDGVRALGDRHHTAYYDHRGSGGFGAERAVERIFYRYTVFGVDADQFGRAQVWLRVWFAICDVVTGHDSGESTRGRRGRYPMSDWAVRLGTPDAK
jgi:hypothetical protein